MTAQVRKRRSRQQSKPPLWQRQRIKTRDKQVEKKPVVGLTAFLLVVLLIGAGFLYRVLSSGIWKGEERFNLLIGEEGEGVALLSVPSDDQDILVWYFEPNVLVNSVYGYGEYKVGSLLGLGRLEGLGSSLLLGSMQQTLGMRVHDFLPVHVASAESIDVAFLQQLIRPMLLSTPGSPLGVTDVGRYAKAVSQIRPDQVNVLPIHESRLAYSTNLPDNSLVYSLDLARIDGYLQETVFGWGYAEERLGVAIVNTTPHAGLASSLSRLLLNSGIDVVSIGENQEKIDKSIIFIKNNDLKKTKTASLISGAIQTGELKVGAVDEYRADIVILLGEDYFTYLSEKPEE